MSRRTAHTDVETSLGYPRVRVGGLDEVGRGPAAGPLVIAVAVLPSGGEVPVGLTDSKLLTGSRRTQMAAVLRDWLDDYGVGAASAAEVDTAGVSAALHLAARRAMSALRAPVEALIVDGPHDYVRAPVPTTTLPKADQQCASVAAASVLAKVARDEVMSDLGRLAPQYGFADNAGYLTPAHLAALEEHGPTTLHRTSWRWMDALPQWQHRRRAGSQLTLL